MLNILYITRAKLSLSRAHTQNILKTAEHLSDYSELHIEVFSSAKELKPKREIFLNKAITKDFRLDISPRKRSLVIALLKKRRSFDMLYFRDPFLWHIGIIARFLLRKNVFFEVHGSHEWRWGKIFWCLAILSAHGLVFITEGLKKYYHSKKPSIVVHCSGINMSDYENMPEKKEVRNTLHLPKNRTLVIYVGSFLWYSIDMFIDILKYLPESVSLVVVGAKDSEKKKLESAAMEKELGERLICITRVPPKNVPYYLAAADVLLNPVAVSYPGSISSKIYEYLASGKPIVSSGNNAIREVLTNRENALLVHERDPKYFADAVREILENDALRLKITKHNCKEALRYMWEERVRRIVSFIYSVTTA